MTDVWQPPAGGRGYYRTASLVSIWATAPFLHNNSVGTFNGDPSVNGRIAAFNDGDPQAALARGPRRPQVDQASLDADLFQHPALRPGCRRSRRSEPSRKLPDAPAFKHPEVFRSTDAARRPERHPRDQRARSPVAPDRRPGRERRSICSRTSTSRTRRNGWRPFWLI